MFCSFIKEEVKAGRRKAGRRKAGRRKAGRKAGRRKAGRRKEGRRTEGKQEGNSLVTLKMTKLVGRKTAWSGPARLGISSELLD